MGHYQRQIVSASVCYFLGLLIIPFHDLATLLAIIIDFLALNLSYCRICKQQLSYTLIKKWFSANLKIMLPNLQMTNLSCEWLLLWPLVLPPALHFVSVSQQLKSSFTWRCMQSTITGRYHRDHLSNHVSPWPRHNPLISVFRSLNIAYFTSKGGNRLWNVDSTNGVQPLISTIITSFDVWALTIWWMLNLN